MASALAHVGFWDRFLAVRWRAALVRGPGEQPTYLPDELSGLLKAELAPAWTVFAAGTGRAAIGETLAAARAVDGSIAGLPAETPVGAILAESQALLDRSIHRREHLDAIGLALAGWRPVAATMAGVVCVVVLPSRSQVRGIRSVGRGKLQESDQMRIGGLSRGQAGQGLAEYALILALIAIVAVSALLFLGGSIDTILSTVDGSI